MGLLEPQPDVRSAPQPGAPMPAMPQGVPPRLTNDAAGKATYDALPMGAPYIDPTGTPRTKGGEQRTAPMLSDELFGIGGGY